MFPINVVAGDLRRVIWEIGPTILAVKFVLVLL